MDQRVGIVGNGRVAQTLRVLLSRQGWHVSQASRTPAPGLVELRELSRHAEAIIVAVNDDAVESIARQLTLGNKLPQVALHTSGAAGPEALETLRTGGTAIGVLHPLQTIPTVEAGLAALPGARFAYAGDPAAEALARDLIEALGGHPLKIRPERWTFYHAAAVMASNYQVALMDAALELMEGAGVDRVEALQALAPLARQANTNIITLGTDAALTGPIRRGDLGTVLRHVRALVTATPQIRALYAAAGNQTLTVAERAGLPAAVANEMRNSFEQSAG